MDAVEILELEKEYQKKITDFIFDESFLKDLKKLEKGIKKDYLLVKSSYEKTQKLSDAFERILWLRLPSILNNPSVFPLPISSDISLYDENIVLWVDAKAYDRHGNPGDLKEIEIGENQLTTPSLSRYKKEIIGLDGNTFTFPGFQVSPNILKSYPNGIYGDKPIFSYVIQLWSYDDGQDIDLEKIEISCIPHILSYEMTFNDSILASTKGYKYYKNTYKDDAIYGYYERDSFPSDFKIVQYHDAIQLDSLPPIMPKNMELRNIALLDPNNSNPRDPHSSLLRNL